MFIQDSIIFQEDLRREIDEGSVGLAEYLQETG